ncbi:hypothetical protein [Litoreibacter arenae]|uniref:Uncharacterized protein n=1 Tax=Litoreibacter arenae DSM 19593 TaxID=1123360 RepID=S9QE66_9RHOB|nr:hypothetical protein [Litoreibacter arenae]EPX78217.1 hypothetical protein thalar_02446 [Litoreibacter arenae DSM 19593]
MHLKDEWAAADYAGKLEQLPKSALEVRLEQKGNFHIYVRPLLHGTLGKK